MHHPERAAVSLGESKGGGGDVWADHCLDVAAVAAVFGSVRVVDGVGFGDTELVERDVALHICDTYASLRLL